MHDKLDTVDTADTVILGYSESEDIPAYQNELSRLSKVRALEKCT